MGLTCLDTGVVIGFLDQTDPHHRSARAELLNAITKGSVLLPGIAYSETLVAVLRSGADTEWLRTLLSRLRIDVGSCSQAVLARGAQLRAEALEDRRRRQWKLPDALIVAEAIENRADTLITTDASWPVLGKGPEVRVLTGV